MLEQLKEKWELIKNNLKEEYDITSVSFDTWIKPLELAAVEGGKWSKSPSETPMINL